MRIKNADILCNMLTSLVSLQQGNVKKSEKLIKIVNIVEKKYWYLLTNLRNFNETVRKDVTYDNIKSHKKTGCYRISEEHIFGKTKREGGKLTSPSLFRVNINLKCVNSPFLTICRNLKLLDNSNINTSDKRSKTIHKYHVTLTSALGISA